MNLPNAKDARVDRVKIVGYLLNREHPDGSGKAAFFERFGFTAERWEVLADALKEHGRHATANKMVSEYGVRYSVDGELQTPCGRRPKI